MPLALTEIIPCTGPTSISASESRTESNGLMAWPTQFPDNGLSINIEFLSGLVSVTPFFEEWVTFTVTFGHHYRVPRVTGETVSNRLTQLRPCLSDNRGSKHQRHGRMVGCLVTSVSLWSPTVDPHKRQQVNKQHEYERRLPNAKRLQPSSHRYTPPPPPPPPA